MNRTIQAADLRDVVNEILEDYASGIEEASSKAVETTASDTVKRLKTYPVQFNDHKYSKGWTKKVVKHRLYSEAIVYNKTAGHLTHLLEFGHLTSSGRRTTAYPHIAPVNDEVPELFEDNFADAIANT